jgi:hypothetical protein
MFARARLPFHQAPVLASPENSLSPMIPTLAHPSVNPNHSRTYVITRGGGSPSSISHHSRITTYPPAKFFPCVSYVKTGGYPSWSYQFPATEYLRFFYLRGDLLYFLYLLLPHSPPIHNPVTAPSPILLLLLSQSTPVRGPTLTPCLSLSQCLRYTSTDAIRPARSAHETRFNH